MKIFALWNQNPIPQEYQDCLSSWGARVEVIRGESRDMIPMLWADHERFRLLADETFYPDDDVMYVDVDTIPAIDFESELLLLDKTKPCFFTLRGADYEICAMIRWQGQYGLYQRMYEKHKNDACLFSYKIDIDSIERNNIGRLHGYPDDKVIQHLNLSSQM
jgi:hypothetical protein